MKLHTLSLLIGGVLLASCGDQVLFEQNIKIDDAVWNSKKPVVFEVDVQDTVTGYDFFINVRNTGAYKYSNFYMFINTGFPFGKTIADTVECPMATPDGEWLGSGVGDLHDQSIMFKRTVNFPVKGKYRFEFIQAMREDPLSGISDIGLRIEKSNPNK
jgi:gliding motility-associated lipoprotein GldH